MTEFNETFDDYIKGYVQDKLSELAGTTVYGADLATTITQDDNYTGGPFVYNADAKNFIKTYWGEAGETYEDLKFNFGKEYAAEYNAFEEPNKFSFMMIQYGVNNLLSECKYLEEPNWNSEFTLTKPVINQIMKDCGIEFREERFGLDECTVDEISELKSNYLSQNYNEITGEEGEVSMFELINADELVTDEMLSENLDCMFTKDDFFCNLDEENTYSTARATSGENRSGKTENTPKVAKDEVL